MFNKRSLAVEFKSESNNVTFYMLPFDPLRTQQVYATLARQHPERAIINVRTGKTTDELPAAYIDAQRRAEQSRDKLLAEMMVNGDLTTEQSEKIVSVYQDEMKKSDWQVKKLWTMHEMIFCVVSGATVDIEFGDGELSLDERTLKQYWTSKPADVFGQWTLFSEILTQSAYELWQAAYTETRARELYDAQNAVEPIGEGDTDPNS